MSAMPRCFVLLCAAALPAMWPAIGRAEEPTSPETYVGRTDYARLPFQNDVFRHVWGGDFGFEPMQLFFQSNPASPFNDPATMRKARAGADGLERAGIVPFAGVQRWEDTYAAAFPPGTFRDVPGFLAADEARGFSRQPEFVAWRDFIAHHPQYWDVAFDGGTMPSEPYYRAWGGQWGFIAPGTPLDLADCPPDLRACDWGDLWAYRWALTSARSGAYGVTLSDFTDSQPDRPSSFQDFNPRIVASFLAGRPGAPAPTIGAAQAADWIVRHDFNAWNDALGLAYGRFYRALAERIGAVTHRRALIVDQRATTPSERRLHGTDERLLARTIGPASYLCTWDDHLIQADRPGPLRISPIGELAGFAVGAAR